MENCKCFNGYDSCGDKFIPNQEYEYELQGQFIAVHVEGKSWVCFTKEKFDKYFKIKENK